MVELPDSRHPGDQLRRELSLADATLLCIASVIGSGIFLTPGSIAELLPDARLVLLAWALGGLLSLAGALANAELGTMFPHAGGDYVYVREAFHPMLGFLVGWLTFFVIYAGTIATLGAGFAGTVAGLLGLPDPLRLSLAIAVILLATWLNVRGVRAGLRFSNWATGLKVGALALFVLIGPYLADGSISRLAPAAPATGASFQSLGLALSPVLFSYLGWNAAVYVASEVRAPWRNLPRALLGGLLVCTTVYLLVNLVYLLALPVEAQRGSPNVGESAARALFGELGGLLVTLFVLVSILGALNATILVGPRIAYAMALDGRFFGRVDTLHATRRTPHLALAVQAGASVGILLLLGTFPSALDYTTFAVVLATMLDTAALYALRVRRPQHPRPYRALGYPWLPAAYLIANAAIAVAMLRGRPFECLTALALGASGVPFYLWFRRLRARA